MNDWRDLGITDEQLFTADGLDYWKQQDISYFLRNLVNEIGQEERGLHSLIQFIRDETEFKSVPVSNELNGDFILDGMESRLKKIYHALDLMRVYANDLEQNTNDEQK